jgi:cytosine deaminase
VTVVLRQARLSDGSLVDVTIEEDRIATVEPSVGDDSMADRPGGVETVDLAGRLLVPAPAEPHAHLDKALTIEQVPNPSGDLMGAIDAWMAHRPGITHDDYVARATAAAQLLSANGCTAIRTHVDLGSDIGTAGLEALLEVKEKLAGRVELQTVGLIHGLTGRTGPPQRAVLRQAIELGLDVVGGVPHLEANPTLAIDLLLDHAGRAGLPVDLHADDNLDPTSKDLATLADRVLKTGFEPVVTASHCCALGMAEPGHQQDVAAKAADAGVNVVTLPVTNLYLQARDHASAAPRGLTAVAPLVGAGVNVAAGADNLRDPFNPVGRADPLETASLVVVAAHRSPVEAYEMVSNRARVAMGLEPVVIEAGAPAELMALPATSVGDAVAAAPADRQVIHRGRLLKRLL